MLAAPVGVDRPGESQIRRVIACQDRLGLLMRDLGLHGRRLGIMGIGRPAVINPLTPLSVEAVKDPGGGTPPFEGRGEEAIVGQHDTVYLYSKSCHLPSAKLSATRRLRPQSWRSSPSKTPVFRF